MYIFFSFVLFEKIKYPKQLEIIKKERKKENVVVVFFFLKSGFVKRKKNKGGGGWMGGGLNQSGEGVVSARLLPGVVQDVSAGCVGWGGDGRSMGWWSPSVPSLLNTVPDPRTLPPPCHLLTSSPPTQRSLQANHQLRGQ